MSENSDFNFCWEHSGRTCCSVEDVSKVRTKIALAKLRSSGDGHGISDQCLSMSVRASCAECDGDIVSSFLFNATRVGYREIRGPLPQLLRCLVPLVHERLP